MRRSRQKVGEATTVAEASRSPIEARRRRLRRRFKLGIMAATLGIVAAGVWFTPRARYLAGEWGRTARRETLRTLFGLEPTEAEIEADLAIERAETERRTRESLTSYYQDKAPPAIQNLFDAARMDPAHGLIGVGRADNGFLLSPDVFEPDPKRSYRLRPNLRSVWLRQITLLGGPFGLFLVADTPEMRSAALAGGAIVDEPSRQTTNSWGLRGPEPNLDADLKVLVLGDSFMQGMFNGDDDTPPMALQRALADRYGVEVSVLNTGHIGYAPEQYLTCLLEYGPRFEPDCVVVSVCPNDFGDGDAVMAGVGDDWGEAGRRLGEIAIWCRGRTIPYLVVAAPVDRQILGVRSDQNYPAPIPKLLGTAPVGYLNPFEEFLDEHLRLQREAGPDAHPDKSLLFNGHINDNHFSPLGAELWAEAVARRLESLLKDRFTPRVGPASDAVAGERPGPDEGGVTNDE